MTSFDMAGMPASFHWHAEPEAWQIDEDGSLSVRAGPKTDFFNDPASGARVATAPCALMETAEPSFVLSVQVAVVAQSTFDAGLIFVRTQHDHWAKFCVEQSPAGDPTIVSVVTRGVSDDCNHAVLRAPQAYLRVAKTRRTVAFHYSVDGTHWQLARYCSLGEPERLQIGWVAQSPVGEGCEAAFRHFSYRTGELANLRDGQ
jgi:regulation of enolase protein 1 (concanavalin A-like superfamily)